MLTVEVEKESHKLGKIVPGYRYVLYVDRVAARGFYATPDYKPGILPLYFPLTKPLQGVAVSIVNGNHRRDACLLRAGAYYVRIGFSAKKKTKRSHDYGFSGPSFS